MRRKTETEGRWAGRWIAVVCCKQVCPLLPDSHVGIRPPQGDDIMRWVFGEAISNGDKSFTNEIRVHIKRLERALTRSPHEDRVKEGDM